MAAEEPVVREGWDWSLPEQVKPHPYSGYVTWGRKRFHEWITVSGVHIRWKELNPAPGQYNWDLLRDRIAANREAGMRTGIHLKGVELKGIPDWIMETYKPPIFDVPLLNDNQPWRLKNIAAWQPDVDRSFHEFLKAFCQTGIPQSDDVVYGYIHGISPSRGEELWMRRGDLEMYEKAGLTPERFGQWLRRRIDAMCEAFKGVEYKLAWMAGGPVGPTAPYRAATEGLADYAFSKGTGIRGGGIDFMHGLFNSPSWGSRLTPAGYCVVDDEHPSIAGGRFRGDENEEYGKYWEWRFGPAEGYAYRHRISCLRGLQMRQNFQMVSRATRELNPDLNRYVMRVQGYRRGGAPDAWAYLRQCPTHKGPVKNIERWLIQRDLPGSMSQPAERVDRYKLGADPRGTHYDFDARRTDMANGQKGLLFKLDRVFRPKPAPATIKVTYTDRARARWWIRYRDAEGAVRRTGVVGNTGDGKRKTATFRIDSLAASGAFPDDEVFKAWFDAEPDNPANLVRNAELANGGDGWSMPELYTIQPDPERPGESVVHFMYRALKDTVHMDQLIPLKKGKAYRLSAQIRNDGKGLKPGVRIGRMDWSTVVYPEAKGTGRWEDVSAVFVADADATFRLQLFGQGRGNYAKGLSGTSAFRRIALHEIPARALLQEREMDFRLETDGPGDVTITLVRVIKPQPDA